jgi:hypothetical protein
MSNDRLQSTRTLQLGRQPGRRWLQLAFAVFAAGCSSRAYAQSPTHVAGWGAQRFDGTWGDLQFLRVSAGGQHTLVYSPEHGLTACGSDLYGQCRVPPAPAATS